MNSQHLTIKTNTPQLFEKPCFGRPCGMNKVQFSMKEWRSNGTVHWNNLKKYLTWTSSTPKVLQGPGDKICAMFLWTQCMWKVNKKYSSKAVYTPTCNKSFEQRFLVIMGSNRTAPLINFIYGSVSISLKHRMGNCVSYMEVPTYFTYFSLNKTEP